MNKFYITSAIPYVNAKPHIGHALEFVQADTIARYERLLGKDVLLLSGGDENALKNVQAAEQAGKPIQEFIDENTRAFYDLSRALHVQYDVWQKGSDINHHYPASQKLWEMCNKNDDIYKKSYKGLYCVGCETFYTRNELNKKGECFEHPGKPLQEVEEENYFFRLSKYQDQLLSLFKSDTFKVSPDSRKNEIVAFIQGGLQDFSISRSNERAKNWGVPVPGDPSQRIYVWFDALNIYQSGVGFGWDEKQYQKWWPADLHVIGKGIIRFHAIYWPAILLSAKLPLPQALFVHEYFTVNGQKMSKTLGNVIDPLDLVNKYGAEALRYYFLAKFSPFSDSDFSEEKLHQAYISDLSNGLGNLIARVARLAENVEYTNTYTPALLTEVKNALQSYQFNAALEVIWNLIRTTDQQINQDEPWKIKESSKLERKLSEYVKNILIIAHNLQPFLPDTAKKILTQFQSAIKTTDQLFPRIKP